MPSFTIESSDLAKGLRPSKRTPRNAKYLVKSAGAVGRDGVLQALDELTRIDTDIYALGFDDQTGSFTAGKTIHQYPSGATGVVDTVTQAGGVGTLHLINISGTFVDNEIIYESALGEELLSNIGFEVGGTGDDFDGGAEVDDGTTDSWTDWRLEGEDATHRIEATATKYSGNYAVKSISESSPCNLKIDNHYQSPISEMGGEYALFSGYFRGDGSAYFDVYSYDRTNAAYPMFEATRKSGTSYENFTHAFAVRAGCIDLEIGFRLLNTVGTVYVDEVSLKQITNAALANGTASVFVDAFPFPQLFVFTNVIIVCGQKKIYEWVAGALSAVKITASVAGSTWTALDFHDYIYLSNGQVVIERNPGDKTYSETTNLPTAMCACNFNGQVILGGPDVSAPGASLTMKADPFTVTTSQHGSYS